MVLLLVVVLVGLGFSRIGEFGFLEIGPTLTSPALSVAQSTTTPIKHPYLRIVTIGIIQPRDQRFQVLMRETTPAQKCRRALVNSFESAERQASLNSVDWRPPFDFLGNRVGPSGLPQ